MSKRNEHHYLPVDDQATEWGIYLTTAGRVLDRDSPGQAHGVHPDMYLFDWDPAPRHAVATKSPRESGRILPEFQVAYITDSHAVFESERTGVVEFDGPTLLFLFPGVWHRYRPVGSDKAWLKERWLGFNGDVVYRLLDREFITPETAVRPAARPRRLAAAFDRLIDRVATNPAADPILLSMHAMELLATSIESAQDGKDGKDGGDDLVSRVLDLIWTSSHQGLSMEQLCESVGANRRTVERRFRATRGHSLLTEVNLCRCRRARHFLKMTDLPVKNICWLAGFNNTEQMRVTFQQLVGTTPAQYRRKHQRR
jgi:AraC-like DNA-binding protein